MLKEQVLETIKNNELIESGDGIVIGVSGGPDSISLLHILIQLKNKLNIQKIVVAHINHMVREDAISDEEYVEKFCKKYNIEIYIKRINIQEIANTEKIGLELAGRKARYEFYDEILQKTNCNKIATAHNANDVAETLIMNLLRGSGTSGLKAIQAKRDNKYIRPLINSERKDIENYCKKNELNPRYDYTNKENTYTRNKIRNIVIPYIEKEFNPNIIKTLNRLSEIATLETEYIDKQVIKIYNQIIEEETKEKIIMNLHKFNEQELVIKRRIVLYTINKLLGTTQNIEKIHIQDIIKLCNNNIGNKYLMPNNKIKILIKKGKIYFTQNTSFRKESLNISETQQK